MADNDAADADTHTDADRDRDSRRPGDHASGAPGFDRPLLDVVQVVSTLLNAFTFRPAVIMLVENLLRDVRSVAHDVHRYVPLEPVCDTPSPTD